MSKRERIDRHLSAERMQDFLDGAVPPREASRVRDHVSQCARCRAEMEAWNHLFEDLGELAEVAPGIRFEERVLGALPAVRPARLSWWARLTRRLAGPRAGVSAASPVPVHPTAEALQEYLDGALGKRAAAGIEGHLHVCGECRADFGKWSGLGEHLGRLPRLAPSPELQERVMAHVRVQVAHAMARAGRKERLQLLARRVSPRTRRRIAALAGAGITPAVTLGLVAYTVLSHPLATFRNLMAFVWLQGSEMLGAIGAEVTSSDLLEPLLSALQMVGASPASAALALAGLLALSASAAWVLYRYVVAPPEPERLRAR